MCFWICWGGEEGSRGLCEVVYIVGFSGEPAQALYTGCIHGVGKGVGEGLFLGG